MRSPVAGIVTLFLLFVLAIIGYSSVFTVDMTEQALVVRLGDPVRVVTEPGVNFKAPCNEGDVCCNTNATCCKNQNVIANPLGYWYCLLPDKFQCSSGDQCCAGVCMLGACGTPF